jgi:hypothetical protein
MVIFITLLAGFVPLLQVTFITLLEDLYPGRLAVKDRDKTPRITGVILIMWYQSSTRTVGYCRVLEITGKLLVTLQLLSALIKQLQLGGSAYGMICV